MADQAKNMMIGFFVIAAFSIVVFMLMFLNPGIGDHGRILRVRFANIDKVNIGTRVTYAGRPVGEVIDIQEIPGAFNERNAVHGFVYTYELTLKIDSHINIYNTDTIDLRTSGLLGERSVCINPGSPLKGEELILMNDKIIYATETGSLEQTMKEFKELADSFEETFESAKIFVDDLNKAKLVEKITATVESVRNIAKALDNPQYWSEMLTNAHKFTESVNESWKTVDKTLNNALAISVSAKEVMGTVQAGKGTVGKLLVDDAIYLKTSSLLSKAEITLNDVNHYGILFHLDKGWQRLRARRLNLMQQLSTPQEFRNYFNDEIDRVTTSLTRVSSVLDETNGLISCEDLLENGEYTKVYSELLRRVNDLQEQLQMYNQQVVDVGVYKTELNSCLYE
jgi:phospholipid/cholesterol/gamma-HCH transport system substrate-binding protein